MKGMLHTVYASEPQCFSLEFSTIHPLENWLPSSFLLFFGTHHVLLRWRWVAPLHFFCLQIFGTRAVITERGSHGKAGSPLGCLVVGPFCDRLCVRNICKAKMSSGSQQIVLPYICHHPQRKTYV